VITGRSSEIYECFFVSLEQDRDPHDLRKSIEAFVFSDRTLDAISLSISLFSVNIEPKYLISLALLNS